MGSRGIEHITIPSRANREIDLLNGPVGSTLFCFSLPFMFSILLQTLYTTIDTVIVGQYLGSNGLSAVSNGSQLVEVANMILVGFSTAGQVLISQAVGAGKKEAVQQIVSSLFYIIMSAALGICCIYLIFYRFLLDILNTPPEAVDQAGNYIVICSFGFVFIGLYNMFSAVFSGRGDSVHPLLFVLIASAVNIILDILFVAVFRWNVAGAAAATVLGQGASVLFCIRYLKKNPKTYDFSMELSSLRFDRESGKQLLYLGIPHAMQSVAVHFSFLFVIRLINTAGVAVSAAFGVVQKIRNLPNVLTRAVGLGAGTMFGQNLGAGRYDRVSSVMRWCLFISTGVHLVFGLFLVFNPILSFQFFTQDESVLEYASLCIMTLLLEFPAKSLMTGCNALVSAQGNVKLSMVVAFLDAFVGRVFLTWLFGVALGMGTLGLFLGYGMGTYLTAIPVFVYYISGLWKRKKYLYRSGR